MRPHVLARDVLVRGHGAAEASMAGNVTGAQQVTSDYTAQVPTATSDISQCPEKTSIGTFALLKAPTGTFTIKCLFIREDL